MGRLENKVAIITGASRGIGACMAVEFAKQGAKIVIAARSEDGLQKTKANVEAVGGSCIYCVGDLALEASWKKLVAATVQEFGKIDILVNNCGIHIGGYAEKTSLKEWDETIACNLTSYFLGIHYVIPEMKEHGGSIINVGSVASLKAGLCCGFSVAYATTKHAILGLTREVAQEAAQYSIRCNALCPGGTTNSDSAKSMGSSLSPEMHQRIVDDHPLPPHLNAAVDVANAAIFLASDESRTITGATLAIDCGQSSK